MPRTRRCRVQEQEEQDPAGRGRVRDGLPTPSFLSAPGPGQAQPAQGVPRPPCATDTSAPAPECPAFCVTGREWGSGKPPEAEARETGRAGRGRPGPSAGTWQARAHTLQDPRMHAVPSAAGSPQHQGLRAAPWFLGWRPDSGEALSSGGGGGPCSAPPPPPEQCPLPKELFRPEL